MLAAPPYPQFLDDFDERDLGIYNDLNSSMQELDQSFLEQFNLAAFPPNQQSYHLALNSSREDFIKAFGTDKSSL